ncbi:MAG TPA: CHASE domain-containing protein, partial [Methylibium sp.]|nr:CHASE domain-containing protein [Methylibium sp.]
GGAALAALLLLLAVLGALVFGAAAGSAAADRRLVYLFIPCIAWAAYRHGPRGVALGSLVTAGLAVWGTTRGLGPFARGNLNDSLIVLQTYVGLCAVTGLVLAADRSERRRLGRDSALRQDLAAPWLVLLGCLGVAVLGWHLLASDTERQASERFGFLAAGIEARVADRMRQHEQVLRGAAGLFAASKEVDRDEWRRYVEQLDLARNYPGIQAIGWAQRLQPQELEAHVAAVRAEGYPEYALRPAGARDEYSAIVYIEPFDARNRRAFGFDMSTEPVRRAAMALARDGGGAALSGRVTLVQETAADVQPGVLLYLPVYRRGAPVTTPDERRAALLGYVYSPYRMNDLMRGILGPELGGLKLRILDAAASEDVGLLYDSGPARIEGLPLVTASVIDLPGRRWRLEVQALPAFEATIDRQKAQIVLIAGVGLSLLLFALVRSLTLTRERAEMLADDMTAALRDRERAAHRAEHQLRAVMDATPLGVFFTDPAGAWLYTNRSWQRIAGIGAEQALGEGWLAAVHEDDRDAVHAAWRQAGRRRARYEQEHRVRRPDGSVAWVRAIAAPLDDEGFVVGHVGIVEDVTERRAMDADLAAKNEALLRSNTELAQFAYVASHDLQEPLRTVASYSQLLLRRHRDALGGEAQEFLGYIGDGARRAQALIVDLLSLARVDSAARPFEPVALDEVVADVRQSLEAALADSGATLTHDPLPRVLGDRGQLMQLMQNLIGNAIKFRAAGPPRVHVGATRRPDGRWRITVTDNGIGIDARFHERIFTLFQRLHGRDDYPGTGIGLAVCKKVVERHGGQIGVESAPGRGATFHFTLAPADEP